MMRRAAIAALIAIAAAPAACGGASTSPSVVAPTATVTTETFTGTVQQLGTNVHTFTVATPGTVNVTMTAAGPPATITMGLGIGNPSATGTCIFLANGTTQAIASASTPQLSGALSASGAYCVAIGDIGNAAGPVTYSVTVSHT
jgi:ABC-type glycerol-3-phosphate transport system substrate-binding protein